MAILDIHTHRQPPYPEGVVSLRIDGQCNLYETFIDGQLYSAGVHPWDLERLPDDWSDTLGRLVRLPQVIAVGECGVDLPRGGMLFRQLQVFRRHVELSEEVGKPLIIHDVKSDDIICGLRRDLKPRQPWVVHGFRGKPAAAASLLKSGCYLSFGEHFNPDTLRSVPEDRILAETDESAMNIGEIIRRLSDTREEDLMLIIKSNSEKFCNFEG